ncbi:MAG: hypothetical protein [Microviridae sp.]|nr:MAG: hypothetical protein [Microviridae sp.]
MIQVKNYLNRDTFPKKYKAFTMPSETVPDQSLTIRQILDRYARGLPLDVKTPIWEEDDELNPLPDVRTLDLTEKQEMLQNAKDELQAIKVKMAEKRKKKAIVESQIINPPSQLEN